MTAEAHHYEELHRLVDRLRPSQAEAVHAVVYQFVTAGERAEPAVSEQPRRHFSFAGSMSAEPDFAERSEDVLEEITRRNKA